MPYHPLISIVVPVYNVEEYLEACLESIARQTYANIEVLIVNDGSRDNSGEICSRYVQSDSRFKLLIKENGGLSDARNYAFEYINGDYIAYVDADDVIEPEMMEYLIESCLNLNVKMAFCNYFNIRKGDEKPFADLIDKVNVLLVSQDELIAMMFQEQYRVVMPVMWNKIYHRSIFESIRFPFGKYHEDEFIIHRILGSIGSAAYVSKALYAYRIRSGSITGKMDFNRVRDKLEAYCDRVVYFFEKNMMIHAQSAYSFYVKQSIWESAKCYQYCNKNEFRIFLKAISGQMKKLLKTNVIKGSTIGINAKCLLFSRFPYAYIRLNQIIARTKNLFI